MGLNYDMHSTKGKYIMGGNTDLMQVGDINKAQCVYIWSPVWDNVAYDDNIYVSE